jgi:hypothetical protein
MNEPNKWTIEIPTDKEGAQKFLKTLQELFLIYPPIQVDDDTSSSQSSYRPFKDGEDPF